MYSKMFKCGLKTADLTALHGLSGRHTLFYCAECYGLKPHNNTFCDPHKVLLCCLNHIVVLVLGVFCVPFIYVYKVPRDRGLILTTIAVFFKNKDLK